MDVNYPPEPWHLTGHCLVGTFLVPADQAPPLGLPSGARAITVFGRRIIAVAFFVYEQPSPLTYNEVMCTVLVRRGLRPFVNIPFIEVDSPASQAGGRELWSIPKGLNDFTAERLAAYTAKGVAALRVRNRITRALPALPIRFHLLQGDDASGAVTSVSGKASIAPLRGDWDFDPSGPLAFLAGRRPVASMTVPRFVLRFGGATTKRW